MQLLPLEVFEINVNIAKTILELNMENQNVIGKIEPQLYGKVITDFVKEEECASNTMKDISLILFSTLTTDTLLCKNLNYLFFNIQECY